MNYYVPDVDVFLMSPNGQGHTKYQRADGTLSTQSACSASHDLSEAKLLTKAQVAVHMQGRLCAGCFPRIRTVVH